MTDAKTLEKLIIRLETLGQNPRTIYLTLSKRFDPKMVEKMLGDITGWKQSELSAPVKPRRSAAPLEVKSETKLSKVKKTSRKGHPISPATRAKLSAAKAKWWQQHPEIDPGWLHTPEVRAQTAARQRGRKIPEETKARMAASMRLYWQLKRAGFVNQN